MDIVEYLKSRSRWDILERGTRLFIESFVSKIQEEFSVDEKPVLDIYFDPTCLYHKRIGFVARTTNELAYRDLELADTKLGNAVDFPLSYIDETIDWDDRMEVIKNYKTIIEPLSEYIITKLHQYWSSIPLEVLQNKVFV